MGNRVSDVLNMASLAQTANNVHKAIIANVSAMILRGQKKDYDESDPAYLLNAVGPAAASSAMEHLVSQGVQNNWWPGVNFTSNHVHNFNVIRDFESNRPRTLPSGVLNTNGLTKNDDLTGCPNYTGVLRQFLLPRYAYLDFDKVVDPRHQIDLECGYPKFITPIMYRYMYDRDDVACRVVDLYPDESWAASPDVREREDKDAGPKTPFEEDWQMLCEDYNVLQYLYRIDKLAGIGHYGALLLGVDDGEDLEKPIDEGGLLAGVKRWVGKKQRNLLYLRPFDEYLSFIHQYETDVLHPRYGLPKFYNLVFLDMTIDAAGASIGTRLNRRVHWSRVVHVADNLHSSLVFGVPRQQTVFNRLLDLRKIKGSSAEMFWNGGFPGLSFEVDPRFVADEVEFDKENFKQEIEEYANHLKRYLTLTGIKATSLASQIADPESHVKIQLKAISMRMGVPDRIFMGSEEGRLASSQDKLTWNTRLKRRLRTFTEPYLIRNFVDRLIALGIMRPPTSGKYFVGWEDLNLPTDEDKANLSLKWTQALSQYVASGVIHLIPPMDFLTMILGLLPTQAKRIVEEAKSAGGWSKLLKVDPSEGAGQNGVRKSTTGKAKDAGGDHEENAKRNTADKKAEGQSS